MAKLSQTRKVIDYLRQHPGQRFNARQIAEAITKMYPKDYVQKRSNPRFSDEKSFLTQIVAEIGAHKKSLQKTSPNIKWQDKPRPRVYWFEKPGQASDNTSEGIEQALSDSESGVSEHDLYPVLIAYLNSEHDLYCTRIDEKKSKNNRGSGGNHWLHPDIVAMEPIAKSWHDHVKTCVSAGDGQSVRLWSFEVKKELTMGNVRRCFFQAVSNSSWANEGYLVATAIADHRVEQELRILSALHGIGVIILSPTNPSESDLLLPAQKRPEIDWQSVNRLVEENKDFQNFVDLVANYYQTGRLRERDWSRGLKQPK